MNFKLEVQQCMSLPIPIITSIRPILSVHYEYDVQSLKDYKMHTKLINAFVCLFIGTYICILYSVYIIQSSIGRALNNMIKRSRGVGSRGVF